MVRLAGVSKSFREGGAETQVLHGVGLELARGQTTSLVGRSGSGKSTLISVLAGLLLPDAGSVTFDGHDLTTLDDTARARLRADRIGIVLQRDNLIPFLSASEHVELAMGLAGGGHARTRARALLSELGLGARLHHRPRTLSGGEAQRVAVAVALANEPDLLLADEVTGELDSSTAERVMQVIFEAWRERGLSVLYVTHSAELAARAQRRLGLADGAVHPL
ncbi:MAG TPA: ABC transporter ATP-binding protein [Gaiellales bacterium]|jgi:putative ABC transport system ATP-binding protein|nr:ABC transporter ATP-binding protein [Gaiellales bacterium]